VADNASNMVKMSFNVTEKKMQQEDLTPGYFFRKWTALLLQLENNGGLIAQAISGSMKRREKVLLDNPMILSAVYMDIFNVHLLTSEQKEKARAAVVELGLRLKGLEDQAATEESEMELHSSSSTGDSDSDEEIVKLRKLSRDKSSSQSTFDDCEMEASMPSHDVTCSSPSKRRRKEASARVIFSLF
jgi:hypothetical protein